MGLFSAFVYSLIISSSFSLVSSETQTFIVRVQNDLKPSHYSNVVDWYSSTLRSLRSTNDNDNNNTILHVYKTVFHGFSAKLTGEQARELDQRPEILGVFPDEVRELHTTRSPGFLGLDTNAAVGYNGLLNLSDRGSNVIIGMIDTGIWPERRSFHDEGLGPIPSRWKGECVGGDSFPKTLCNKKLVGVRYFNSGNNETKNSARDDVGHGTHTASIAAGRQVENASCLGYAPGVSSGIAPKARLAVYKVCSAKGCSESGLIAGIDAAVNDGVDVISISIGGGPKPYDRDPLAIAAYGAVKNGIVVSASAGNGGPDKGSVTNAAPWIITVGAGTIDRTFPADLVLKDGPVVTGSSRYDGKPFLAEANFPLIYAGNAAVFKRPRGGKNYNESAWGYCVWGTLDPKLVKGKIVVCDVNDVIPNVDQAWVVSQAGGVGVIVANVAPAGESSDAVRFLTPGISITQSARATLMNYLTTAENPRATMRFRGTQLGVKPAPVIPIFSSRGPHFVSPDVLKPDVIAPGVDILAAWPDGIPLSEIDIDTPRTKFNIVSGTSMSCPHVSGIAGLLKGAHPEWTPAMIKSAMMTTAYTHDREQKPIVEGTNLTTATVWDMGAGHVDPVRAVDPGLVYDLTEDDHIRFLCASNYDNRQVSLIVHKAVKCHEIEKTYPWDLNYPAIAVRVNASRPSKVKIYVPRTVTRVSDGASTYTVKITNPRGTVVRINPGKMVFVKKGDKQSYVVKILVDNTPRARPVSEYGVLTWTDGKHRVTSSIVVTWVH